MNTLRAGQRLSHLRPSTNARERRRPREIAVTGVPGLKMVESLKNPALGIWIHRFTDPLTGRRAVLTYGSTAAIAYADAIARVQSEREMIRRGRSPKGAAVTLDVFVETVAIPWAQDNLRSWKDLASRYSLYWAQPLGAKLVRDISPFDVEMILAELRKPGKSRRRKLLKAATVNRAGMALRTIFRLAKLRGLIDGNPLDDIPQLRENPPPPLALTLDQVRRLLVRLIGEPERHRLLVEFLLETALRIGEALQARFSDVDVQRRLLNLPETKAGVPQIVPMTPRALQIVERLRELSPSEWLFPAARGKGPMSPPRKWLKVVLADVGVDPSASFHSIRKATATIAASQGVDILTISRLLRHSSIRTTEVHYLATDQKNLHGAVNLVSQLMRAPSGTVSKK